MSAAPLSGLRVLELSHTVMGPTAGLIFAELGADVVKLEPAPGGDHTRGLGGFAAGFFAAFNRNKRSMAIDLKRPEGQAAMHRLADEDLALTLALSLHAPDDDLRDELVPVNQRWKVAEVLQAAWDYAARTGRRVSIEYALIRDVNDQPWRADLLGRLLAGKLAHVNLIPLNPTPGSRWDASPKPAQQEFVRRLRSAGIATTVRDTRGREIDGACGQLAASGAEPTSNELRKHAAHDFMSSRGRGRKAEQ